MYILLMNTDEETKDIQIEKITRSTEEMVDYIAKTRRKDDLKSCSIVALHSSYSVQETVQKRLELKYGWTED